MENKYQIPLESCSDKERQDFWSKFISDQITSSMDMKMFCHRHQLRFSQFVYWKYKKKTTKAIYKRAKKLSISKNNKGADRFIPIQVTTDLATKKHPEYGVINNEAIDKEASVEINILFKNGHKLILPSTIRESELLSIIKIAAELRC